MPVASVQFEFLTSYFLIDTFETADKILTVIPGRGKLMEHLAVWRVSAYEMSLLTLGMAVLLGQSTTLGGD